MVQPRNDSALYWALQAEQNNEPGAAEIKERTDAAVLSQLRALASGKRFDEELALINAYAEFYPADAGAQRALQQMRDSIRQAQLGDAVRLQVIHRHGINYRTARCEGWLVIEPDGTASYECDARFPHDARCDRVRFPRGSFTFNTGPDPEQLHFGTPTGNYDFFAAQAAIGVAMRALTAAAARNLR